MKNCVLLLTFILIGNGLMAQKADSAKRTTTTDSLFNSLAAVNKKQRTVVFPSSRLVLAQSTETVKKNNLNFLVIHRFGDAAGTLGGGKTFFGFDNVADVYIGFEYGLTDNLNIDIGRTTIPKTGGLLDVEVKFAAVHQTTDDVSPIAITVIGETGLRAYNSFPSFADRISYFAQVMFAHRFSHGFSLQLAPSIIQNNLPIPEGPGSDNTFLSLSASATLKVTNLLSIVVDYAHPFSSFRNTNGFSDPLGFGIQAVTGGHVFTINITNSKAVSEINYLSNTTSDYIRGQYRIGFTISRTFDFNHKERYAPKR